MKVLKKISLILALSLAVVAPVASVDKKEPVRASAAILTATPTGFTKASDVKYKTTDGTIHNWGVRGEDSTFLSSKATAFYTGSYVYDTLSQQSGDSSLSDAPSSALYKSLQTLMKNKHSHKTSYDETRELYRYTDSFNNNSSYISSFYSGSKLGGAWDKGATWNREHTWPDSKGLGGSDENDIMMLRPTSVSENSGRGNKAYGESSGYYDPNDELPASGVSSVRGDCARIVLYTYVRWGNTGKMWGSSGVMENLNVLLKWMEEDPVDTWEMGRNDSVQSITGTRNVFIDYPEYAWLLFGKEIPQDMTTPSGEGKTTPVDPENPPQEDEPPREEPEDGREERPIHSSSESEEEEFDEEAWLASNLPASSGGLPNCASALGGSAAIVALALLCVYAWRKRTTK